MDTEVQHRDLLLDSEQYRLAITLSDNPAIKGLEFDYKFVRLPGGKHPFVPHAGEESESALYLQRKHAHRVALGKVTHLLHGGIHEQTQSWCHEVQL